MPQIITTDTELRTLIPNVLATVEGESTLYDKLLPFLDNAEVWVKSTFTGNATFDELKSLETPDPKRKLLAKLVATEAFMQAIPNLDLVLTPNGFGIVNNSNVAPASKERVERLINSFETLRDNAIEQFLYEVYFFSSTWEHQPQGMFFAATLFPNLDFCNRCGITAHRWDKYLELRSKLLVIEQELANEYFSEEQMQSFRKTIFKWKDWKNPTKETQVIEAIRNLEVAILTDNKPYPQAARDIVNVIRNNPSSFPEWHASKVAKLFSPELFINKKSAGGYWF